MACCHRATTHYLKQCQPKSISPYGITRPQYVKNNNEPWLHWSTIINLCFKIFCHFSFQYPCIKVQWNSLEKKVSISKQGFILLQKSAFLSPTFSRQDPIFQKLLVPRTPLFNFAILVNLVSRPQQEPFFKRCSVPRPHFFIFLVQTLISKVHGHNESQGLLLLSQWTWEYLNHGSFNIILTNHQLMKLVKEGPGGWFNKKMLSYQYRKSHCGDKTILRPSYLHNGISYTGKMTSLYWIRALDAIEH